MQLPPKNLRRGLLSLLTVLLLLALCVGAPSGSAATADIVVTGDLLSATSVTTTGCATDTPNVTSFSVVAGQNAVTSADCDVTFGSTSNTSMLHMFQADGTGMAMNAPGDTTMTDVYGAGENVTDVNAWDANKVIASTWCHGLLYTADGGATWNNGTVPNDCVFAVDWGSSTVAYAAGNNGSLYKTSDSGATWTDLGTQPTMTETSGFHDISAASASVVFAVTWSDLVWKSVDGGTTWAQMTTPAGGCGVATVAAWSATNVWVGGYCSSVWFSNDGGSNWTWTSAPDNVTTLDAIGATSAFGAGGATAFKTTTGTAWTDLQVWTKVYCDKNLQGLDALDANTIYASNELGNVYKTVDGGTTWTSSELDMPDNVAGVAAGSASTVFAGGGSGSVFKSTNSGTTWTRQRSDSVTTIVDLTASGQNVYAVGMVGHIESSTNGGQAWTSRTSASGTTQSLWGVAAFGATTPVAVGSGGTIVRSTNSAAGWSSVSSGTTIDLRGIDAADDSVGWAVGKNGTVLKTIDAGQSWNPQSSGVTKTLQEVVAVSRSVAFAVGNGGTIIKTTNGGTTWTSLTSTVTTDLWGVDATSATDVYASGDEEILLHSTDGTSWTSIYAGNWWGHFRDVSVPAAGVIYVNSNSWGVVKRSYDGGATWQDLSHSMTFASLTTIDANTVVVGGVYGTFAYSDAGTSIPDYNSVTNNWSNATNLFGACLRQATGGGVNAIWPTDASCTISDAGHWKAIPATSGPSAKVAESTTSGFNAADVRLRFGMKTVNTLAPGEYSVTLGFDVVAPNV